MYLYRKSKVTQKPAPDLNQPKQKFKHITNSKP